MCTQLLPPLKILKNYSWSSLGLWRGKKRHSVSRPVYQLLCFPFAHPWCCYTLLVLSVLFVDFSEMEVTGNVSWVLQFPYWKSKRVSSELWILMLIFKCFDCQSCISGVAGNWCNENWAEILNTSNARKWLYCITTSIRNVKETTLAWGICLFFWQSL